MTPARLTAVTLAVAALVLTGCSSHGSPKAAASSSAPASSSSAPASLTPSPSPTAPLTIKQARAAYIAIVDPDNRIVSAIINDRQDAAPMSQFHADLRADITALRVMITKLDEARWPVRVQPYVSAMRSTDLVASIHCDQAALAAASYAQDQEIEARNSWCQEAQSTNNAEQIRQLLHLPPVSN